MTAPTGATSTANGAGRAGDLAEAHARLLADRDLQFRMTEFQPPRPPGWLEPLLDMLRALGPLWQGIFWLGLAAIVATILWLIGRELVRIGRSARPEARNLGPESWRPDQAAARVLLSDADALAAQGRFAEAVHLILLRSIDELKARRPSAIRPALTARDIRDLEALPVPARPAFARMAQAVEASLFGGRPVDADAFAACRRDYEAFALPGTWTG
ncbi:DUF4129 domain-containing protein [Brevundimonas sp.]|uniref:DUF4129 domain-containing protein n=1 Tax=Brevundimonas sp. TaxID=1871086 RepID=UPI0035B2E054